MTTTATQSPRTRRAASIGLSVVLVPLAAFAAAVHAAHYLPFISDDALISLRYARRLLDGYGLTWSTGMRVEGYSNLLWVLANAALGATGIDLVDAARVLGFACTLLTVCAAAWLCVRVASSNGVRPSFLAVGAIAASGSLAIWTIGGLEQPLLAAVLAWTLAFACDLVDGRGSTRMVAAVGTGLALLCLTRVDGALLAVTIAAAVLVLRHSQWRQLALPLLVPPLIASAGQQIFRRLYYAAWVPNTALVKLSPSGNHLLSGLDYVAHGVLWAAPLVAAAVLALAAPGARQRTTRSWLLLGGISTVWLGYVLFIGGDIFPGRRHMVPAVVAWALLLASGLNRERMPRSRAVVSSFVLLALVGFGYVQMIDPENYRAITERWEWAGQAVGLLYKHAFGASGAVVAADPAGCIPFWSELPAIDMLGLNDRHIAGHRPADFGSGYLGHELGDGAYVLDRTPDLVVFCGPAGRAKPCFRSGVEMERDPRFRREYVLVTVRTDDPIVVEANVWMRFASERIGIRTRTDEVFVPGYLFTSPSPTIARLSPPSRPGKRRSSRQTGQRLVALITGTRSAVSRVPVAAGHWRIEAASQIPVEVSVADSETGAVLRDASSSADFIVPSDMHLTVAVASRYQDAELESVTFRRLAE